MSEGEELMSLIEALYPMCRSLTGDGVRQSLALLARIAPIEVHEVPSGTPALDWVVPREWKVREAWVRGPDGQRVIDFADSNLHLVSYSTPFRGELSLDELRPHLHTLPEQPTLIPYRTAYHSERWGFCLSHERLEALAPGRYEVCVDTSLEEGSMSYGELVLPGESEEELLISAHICHPSLANDNLSGLAVAAFLARGLAAAGPRRLGLRFLFAPGTLGALAWLAQHRDAPARVKHALTLTCLGDARGLTYKRSERGDAPIDRAAAHVLRTSGEAHELIDFFPYGYDERQYNSPGFRIPCGSLMRGRHGHFPEYHTSADNLSFISAGQLVGALRSLEGIVDVLERDRSCLNLAPFGEPQLGKRGLYRALGGTSLPNTELAMLWVLNQSDGAHSLLDIAERAALPFALIADAAAALREAGLLA